MKERPILFSAPMVRAILAGTKTQTRRVVKPQPEAEHGGEPYWFVGGYRAWTYRNTTDLLRKGGNVIQCPYGQPGDRLWVREAWRTVAEMDDLPPRDLNTAHRIWFEANSPHQPGAGKLRPSMFMPRWASRITLEVKGVRVERLQDISEGDAQAEGVYTDPACPAYDAYAQLWNEINGPGAQEANPWVWVVEFKRLEGGAA